MNRPSRIHRPTEAAALAQATRQPAEDAQMHMLFAALLAAHAVGDRAGARIFAHRIARGGEGR